jgi:hypothetical protein
MSANTIDDRHKTLQQLSDFHQKPIVELLLDLQNIKSPRSKHLEIIRNLTCFRINPHSKCKSDLSDQHFTLHETTVNAYTNREYVAILYVWNIPEEEGRKKKLSTKYEVEKGGRTERSELRDRVLDRLRRCMVTLDLNYLWIERFSIPQKVCKNFRQFNHENCSQKRNSLDAMDLVYKQSNHPVALLELELDHAEDIDLLADLLARKLVYGVNRLKYKNFNRARKALYLVKRITDIWWERAWIFQERYRAGMGMKLLIGHWAKLESYKCFHACSGFRKRHVYRELCISSVAFSDEATRLCLALQGIKSLSTDINQILSAAGKYSLLVEDNNSMGPGIIADVECRSIKDPRDRLAIAANCLQYPVRFHENHLKDGGRSLSLSILAMLFLNGELFHNSVYDQFGDRRPRAMNMTVSKFLKEYSFDNFYAPRDKYRLTFNKGCRLPDSKLTETGIQTRGHLWELREIVYTHEFPRRLPWINDLRRILEPLERRRLLQLLLYLKQG